MKKISIVLVSLIVIFSSCQKKHMGVSINEPSKAINELKKLVLEEGDIDAYEVLETAYLDESPGEFLPYALVMANKYNYPRGHYDVYENLMWLFSCTQGDLSCMDKATMKLANNHLELAAKNGETTAISVLSEISADPTRRRMQKED